jgi:hypothetical protein
MDRTRAYLVDYRLVDCPTVFRGCNIPLAEGHRWAEPSAGHLRRVLREVYENREAGREKGRKARLDILEKYNRGAVAEKMVRRLRDIQKAWGAIGEN